MKKIIFLSFFVFIFFVLNLLSANISLFKIEDNIYMPFTSMPHSMGRYEHEGVRQNLYSLSDTNINIGFTATIMQDEMPFYNNEMNTINSFLQGTIDLFGGSVVKRESINISGKQAVYVVLQTRHDGVDIRSHTVGIFQNGKVHSWAVQDIPGLTGDLAKNIFFSNLNKIKIDDLQNGNARLDNYYIFESGAKFPFPEKPTIQKIPLGNNYIDFIYYMDRGTNILYHVSYARNFPKVDDVRSSFLQGASGNAKITEKGIVQIGKKDFEYAVLDEIEKDGSIFRTYIVIFGDEKELYSYGVAGRQNITGGKEREAFFDKIKLIDGIK